MFSVGIFSCVMLIRQQTCATVGTSYQPAGSYHNYLQPFSRETWANMAHNRKYTMYLEEKSFDNISHCLIALSVWFCFIPLFSFRLLCKERALCIFPEILSQKGVTDGPSHAFVMQALLCYWWRNVLWTESIFIILDDQKPCTFSKVGWDAFSNWGEIVLKKNEMSNIIVF